MKVVFTPHSSSFEESYKKRKYFKKVEDMIEYIINYQKETIGFDSIKSQYYIEWYAFNKNLTRDRFIILFKDYTKKETIRYPVGFFHYEEFI